jgi:hypothetical protein
VVTLRACPRGCAVAPPRELLSGYLRQKSDQSFL